MDDGVGLTFPMVIAQGHVIRKDGHLVQITFVPAPEPESEPAFRPELFDKGIPQRRN